MNRKPFPALKPDQWPVRDRQLWVAARNREGVLDDGGPAASWRPATIHNCERGYGVLLNWFSANGWLEETTSPADRISQDRLRAFIADYSPGRAPLTIAGTVRDIAMVVRACSPPDGLPWLTKLGFRMVNTARPARPKLPRMARIAELLDLADMLMEAGMSLLDNGKVSGAVIYRNGLLIDFLARRALRVRNLSHLRLGDSIHIDEHGMWLDIKAAETKKGVPPVHSLPLPLIDSLRRYLTFVRPVLLRRLGTDDPGWLWLGRRGKRLPETQIATQVQKECRHHLGKEMSPHLFRDAAVTEIAISIPHRIGIAKDVLGHATYAASEKSYNQAGSITAMKALDDVVERLRADDEEDGE